MRNGRKKKVMAAAAAAAASARTQSFVEAAREFAFFGWPTSWMLVVVVVVMQ